jgi:ATP-dependent DNA helicase RecG
MKDINTPVKFLKGVGPQRAKQLENHSVRTIEDLLYYLPRRYEDRKTFITIDKLEENKTYTVKAKITSCRLHRSWKRRNFSIVTANATDGTGKISAVWFNQPFLAKTLKAGQDCFFYGQVNSYQGKLQFNSPEFEIISEDEEKDALNVGRITPIYTTPKFFSQRQLRKLVKASLDGFISSVKEILPFDLRSSLKLPNLAQALINVHFPDTSQLLEDSWRRLSFDDCFLYQMLILLRKSGQKKRMAFSLACSETLLNQALNNLSFKLTDSQQKVLDEIRQDLIKPVPMQRLLQGDVGSGKTIVAFLSSLIAIEAGAQVAFMVPTEIIAQQHYRVLKQLSEKFKKQINISLLTSSTTPAEKQNVFSKINNSQINLLIGTHALLSEKLEFKNLGFVIIDEQHKFGVEQRARLSKKSLQTKLGLWPHCLIMTATPIPRTLAMTLYGDLDVSIIRQLPPGRIPVQTKVYSEDSVGQAYEFLKQVVSSGSQAYIIYPIIEESKVLELKAAKAMFNELKKTYFKDFSLELIHSRIEQKEQERIMDEFYKGNIHILVATSILEVGVDVANANCMLVEEADRFGLSTLHQLRGRVGRSSKQGFCLVVSSSRTETGKKRIQAIATISDGFKIAEADLRIRGPGEFFGREQHGMSDLKIVDPVRQMHILKDARMHAIRLLAKDPSLGLRQNTALLDVLKRKYPGFESMMVTA